MIDVAPYLSRRFNLQTQNCWHLLRDVWLELTGVDLGDRTPERITTAALRARFDTDVPAFRPLPGPADPSIVLMRRPAAVPHVGALFAGRVLQMASGGPSYLPLHLATVGYDRVEFYR